ncbi:AzlD domain-containing protein [uncultured Tessaracoccus sp.]|uniref:AzlD domain-containing protein n=1 Tax=uncultured Tessaracoccus sp. TaxID=905023 RepID=UPI002632F18E|nr:AzlD domain-containing protein [uncultured Tessaracoccus sp.]
MPDLGYFVAVVAVAGAITVGLRAVPFLLLAPLRESTLVRRIGVWMPAGILTILALATLVSAFDGGRAAAALVAAGVTVGVHLLCGRRSLLSIFAGTACFVALVNSGWLGG